MDALNSFPEKGIDTVHKAMMKRYGNPDQKKMDFLGTRHGTEYKWMTYEETVDQAKLFAKGAMALNLLPDFEADGQVWRLIGLQSKNRKEWDIIHISNFFNKATTFGLYDTLGEEAEKFIID
jgi:long-subunit acyl-CoA synthetase (AMP-forming)